jgi:hypothetical protein
MMISVIGKIAMNFPATLWPQKYRQESANHGQWR